ncbi:MAG: tRNA uridine-5-carboxymethylaminomethyl(34) synthesis GTPase MnmE [Pyrinomonadaceae bacterium]
MADTIVALATPAGRSGIGVIRLSGPEAVAFARRLCSNDAYEPAPRDAALKTITDLETGEPIDEAILTYFKAPHSFTGEDVVEVSCHGSPVLLRQVIDACLKHGARLAEPGEFTLRALANGRMNLAEAEAVRDLIDARTSASARQAVRQMRGEFSNRLQPIKDKLLDAIVVLESALEFVEDDLPETQTERLRENLERIAGEIGEMAATFKAGRLLREGLKVTLAGRPNVGKSSLFNALLGTERAIVTEIAGTTRDQINESFVVHGVPVSLMDTAGLRDTTDVVESIGVERSRQAMADADLVVVVIDASEESPGQDAQLLQSVSDLPYVVAVNKIDKIADIDDAVRRVRDLLPNGGGEFVQTSAKTGEGTERLKHAIVHPFVSHESGDTGFLVTDARHHDLLARSRDEILSSLELLEQNASEELTLIGLHNALRYLGQITGETTTEDMLTRIFSTFCIGK